MSYGITIKPAARKELLALPDAVVKRLDRAIFKLSKMRARAGVIS